MKEIKRIGNYIQCPYCEKLYGNGISNVFTNIVESCSCEGMRDAVRKSKIKGIAPVEGAPTTETDPR